MKRVAICIAAAGMQYLESEGELGRGRVVGVSQALPEQKDKQSY
jgi:hypothetical protein